MPSCRRELGRPLAALRTARAVLLRARAFALGRFATAPLRGAPSVRPDAGWAGVVAAAGAVAGLAKSGGVREHGRRRAGSRALGGLGKVASVAVGEACDTEMLCFPDPPAIRSLGRLRRGGWASCAASLGRNDGETRRVMPKSRASPVGLAESGEGVSVTVMVTGLGMGAGMGAGMGGEAGTGSGTVGGQRSQAILCLD